MTAIDTLLNLSAPYAPLEDGDAALFERAMAEADDWHRDRNARYAALWSEAQRPLIPVDLFKHTDLSTPVPGPGMWLGSSGTSSGQATRVFFDTISLARIEHGMRHIFASADLPETRPSRFLLLSPDPAASDAPGYATSFARYTACAPVAECVFAVDAAGRFDAEAAWATLRRWGQDPAPIYLFGLTVWFEQLAIHAPASLPVAGAVKGLTGGGWKGMVGTLERPQIMDRLRRCFGSDAVDIRDIFGLTEHPLHYIACPHGHFHLPRYSRFEILGTDGLPVTDGEAGLIRLQNPFFASLPAHDVLTADLGRRGRDCACGSALPYLAFVGRAGAVDDICAAHARPGLDV